VLLRQPSSQGFAVATTGLWVLIGCASGGAASERLERGAGQVITEEQIERSGARTAWEALRLTVHNVSFSETGRGPTAIRRRGQSSMILDDELRVMVDGVTLTDFTVLARMPASDLLGIEVLSAMDATTYYGTNYPSGLIRIRTKTGG
jgi:outer membrane cobalamin receptor